MMADDLNPTTTAAGDTKKSSARKLSVRKKSSARATSRVSSTSGGGTVTAVVLTDSYGWHDDHKDPTSPRNDAVKGEKITVSKAEFDRGSTTNPQGLAKAGSDKAKAAENGDDTQDEPPLTKPDGHPVDPDLDDLTV